MKPLTKEQRTALLLALPLLLGVDLLQSRNRATEEGNQRFKAGKAEEALAEYEKAAQKLPSDPGVAFNRGTALYALSRFEEASEAFLRATEAKTRDRKAAAFYNLGNSYYQAKKWGEAVAAFKKSLAYDPADMRAKWNLELALRKKTDEEKKGDKDDKKDKKDQDKDQAKNDKNDKQDKKDKQDDKDKQAKDDKKNGDDKGNKPDDQNKQDEQQKPPEPEKEQASKDQSKPPAQAQKPEQPQGGKGDKPPEPRPGTDPREVEAILDNLEKSPKSLEAELAKVRAAHRRPAAKDW
jgi:Ca-activated chloride channel family protein